MSRASLLLVAALVLAAAPGCGPVPPPKNAFESGADILSALATRPSGIRSFRMTGRVDHFGEEHRIQGKIYLFSELPERLRIELVSPFGSPMTVLTVNDDLFAMHDLREGRYYQGPAEPCNIARLIRIPLPVEDVIRVLIGHTPVIPGEAVVTWDRAGYYRVTVTDGVRTQRLRVDGDHNTLPLLGSTLEDREGVVFDITYDRWLPVGGTLVPHEIRVKMPREKTDLLIRYDRGGAELNVPLPDDAWEQSPPPNLEPETVDCS